VTNPSHWTMTPGARRAFGILLVITILFAMLAILDIAHTAHRLSATQSVQAGTTRKLDRTVAILNRTVRKLEREVQSNCRLDSHLAPLPVVVSRITHKPPLLSVEIVSDFRVSWQEAGCQGKLAAPSASFRKWAAFYDVPTG
jgi:hypothetical protein